MTRSVSRSRTIAAAPEVIFALLAQPSRHHEIDGSGTVIAAQDDAPARLSLGSTFGMSMKVGVPYKIENTVVAFVENETIAWKHFGGHVWRYELRPGAEPGTTDVTETFDWSTSKGPLFIQLAGYPKRNARAMEKTLERMAARFAR
jgi:Polyketide cyclase / dehydrase and lipid transport